MTVVEYYEKLTNEKDNKYLKEMEEYLSNFVKNKNDELVVNLKSTGLSELMQFNEDTSKYMEEYTPIKIDENGKIITRILTKKFVDIVANNISNKVSNLSIPEKIFKKLDILSFENLETLTVSNAKDFTKQEIEFILGQTNIKSFTTDASIDEDVLEDSFIISKGNSDEIIYKNKKIIINNVYNFKCKFYKKDIFKEFDKTLDYIDDSIDTYSYYDNLDSYEDDGIFTKMAVELKRIDDKYNVVMNPDSLEDILNVLNSMKNRNMELGSITINLANKEYENIDDFCKLKKFGDINLCYGNSYVSVTVEQFIKMRYTLEYYKDLISSYDLSPLEKLAFAYDIIKSYVYKESDKDLFNSRNIHSIIDEGSIVCVGYSVFLEQLAKEIGLDVSTYSTNVIRDGKSYGHERNIVTIVDSKYGIDGTFLLDATWDCAKGVVLVNDTLTNEKSFIGTKGRKIDEIAENKEIIKTYDDISSYRYFLVDQNNYEKAFPNEKPGYISGDSFAKLEMFNVNSLVSSNNNLSKEKFAALMMAVKYAEGYSIEDLDRVVTDCLEINKYIDKESITVDIGNEITDMHR